MKQQPACSKGHLTFKVVDLYGLHARSTGKLLRFLDEHDVAGALIYKGERVPLDSIIDIMRLNIKHLDVFQLELSKEVDTIDNFDAILAYAGIVKL